MITRNGALLLAPRDPGEILSLLPNAKYINLNGHRLVAAKHNLDTVKVLRNIGLPAPSPILHDGFEFGGRYAPMKHQLTTAEFLTLYSRCYCFNEMRTGKTAASLWAMEYLIQRGYIRKVLIISPVSVLDVWDRELFAVLPYRDSTVLFGTREKRIELLAKSREIAIINFDGVKTITNELEKWKPDLIIVDEASAYCNAQTKRYKALRHLIKPDTRLWLLTGTPTNNAPTDAYGLVKLVNPSKVPSSFKMFKETLMRQVGPYKWIPREGAQEKVTELMQPAIRFKMKDCIDMPPVTFNSRRCYMSEEQIRVFEDVKAKMRHSVEETHITAVNAAVKLIKLQQIMCGIVKDDNAEPVHLLPKNRLEVLDEIIEGAVNKVIVYVPFKFSMEIIKEHLSKKHSVELVNGDTNKTERTRIFTEFQTQADPQIIIAHPKVASHGVDLSAADVIAWYAPIFSSEQYDQANARASGPNQTHPVSIYNISSHPLEDKIYKVLQDKSDMSTGILDMYSSILD